MDELSDKVLRINLVRPVDESYNLVLDTDFPEVAKDLKKRDITKKFGIVTDSKVGGLYGEELKSALKAESIDSEVFAFEHGEKSKNFDVLKWMLVEMARAKYGRDSAVIALGGGVVGDLAGFGAAITRRGVPCIQIPTSTTAMADSAIGGKTAVDVDDYKNLAGTITQPSIAYFIFRLLSTLSDRDYRSGLAETAKHGVIRSKELFDYMERNAHIIIGRDRDALARITKMNCMIKGSVVEIDPYEQGLRSILNYGHTAGHAIESLSGFKLTHGEAVSIGSTVAGRIAILVGTGFTEEDLARQVSVYKKLGNPTEVPDYIPTEDIVAATALDKKARDGKAKYCLPKAIGSMCEFGGKYTTFIGPDIAAKAIGMSR